jgi:hypothetical protein
MALFFQDLSQDERRSIENCRKRPIDDNATFQELAPLAGAGLTLARERLYG